MAVTTITITIFLSMITLVSTILVGHYFERKPNAGTLQALIVSAIAIPIGIVIVSSPLYNIAIYDWPSGSYLLLPPQFAIWAAAFFGVFIGMKSGEVWNQGEPSCIKCLLSLVTVVTLLTLVIVLLP